METWIVIEYFKNHPFHSNEICRFNSEWLAKEFVEDRIERNEYLRSQYDDEPEVGYEIIFLEN